MNAGPTSTTTTINHDEASMPNWCQSKVLARREWAPGLFTVTIDAAGVQPFECGQFLHLGLQVNGELVNRPYSVASPHGPQVEFFVVRVDDGKLTPSLGNLIEGDELLVSDRGAGSFTLNRSPSSRDIWLIGTGTGLAPFIAMVRDAEIWNRYERVVIVHGTRFAADLGYRDELERLAKEKPGRFVYIPAITREELPGVLKGRLNQLLVNGQLEQAAQMTITPSDSTVMICGNPDMLDAVEQALLERNLSRHRSKTPGQIVVERYW
jgi:ferredoxin/flavodoxin---NADP+ reductase